MFKKIITFALVLALCAGMISAFALTSSASTYDGGAGTADDPYIISTEASLKALAEAVNGGADQAGVFFKLGADITLTSEWTPIGLFDDSFEADTDDINTPFSGNFDGAGHKIDGLSITSTNQASIGLFGSIGDNAVVKNVTVNGTITGTARFLGSIVGITALNGTIQNCVSNVVINAKAAGNTPRIGGIVGNMREGTKVEYCVNNGNVTVEEATGTFVQGGIAGDIGKNALIKYCINDADLEAKNIATAYVGGIVARVAGEGATVSDCVVKGNLTASTGITTGCIGGIVSYFNAAKFTLTNSGYVGTITSPTPEYVGYVSGNTKSGGTVENCKVSGDVLLGSKQAGKIGSITGCETGVANIDDMETAVKDAIDSFVNPDTGDMQIVAAVALALASLVGIVAVVSINRKKESV